MDSCIPVIPELELTSSSLILMCSRRNGRRSGVIPSALIAETQNCS